MMKTYQFVAGLFLLLFANLAGLQAAGSEAGNDKKFDIQRIRPDLLLEADAVIRLSEVRFVVKDRKRARTSIRFIATVLNEKGRKLGRQVIQYDKFRKVKKIKGLIRNPDGSVYRKLKKDEIKDFSAISGGSLYDDSRIRYFELYHNRYPYTIELEFELDHNGLIGWPSWYPQKSGYPLELARFELIVPDDVGFRMFPRNLDIDAKITERGGKKRYLWEVKYQPGLHYEPLSPPWSERVPVLMLAPNEFEIDGHPGRMATWHDFAAWYEKLSKGRDVLPDAVRKKVLRLTAGQADPIEKARILYDFFQKNTRYVSVQLGIGGWQPFDARYVTEKGYGDCKALTNYMLAMLKAVGVPSYPALTYRGMRAADVIAEFPSYQFNHVILFVPTAKDTVWLECTSQTIPFGHIGPDNEDRNTLVVGRNWGRIIRTPASAYDQNQQLRRADVVISPSGDGIASVTTIYSGNQQDRVRWALAQKTGRERENWLRKRIDIPRFKLISADFSDVDRKVKQVALPIELNLPRYAIRTGKRLFLKPNLMERWQHVPDAVEERTQPVYFSYAYEDIDSITYKLPGGYRIEAMPDDVEISTDFAEYRASIAMPDAQTLIYKRILRLKKRKLPAEQYEAYRNFVSGIVKADRAQVVLVKK